MKNLVLSALAFLLHATIAFSDPVPVEIIPPDQSDIVGRVTLNVMKELINRNPNYQLTKDQSRFRIVLRWDTTSTGGATVLVAVSTLSPGNQISGIYARGTMGLVGRGDFVDGVLTRTTMIVLIYEQIFLAAGMQDKAHYCNDNVKTNSFDELAGNISRANRIFGYRLR